MFQHFVDKFVVFSMLNGLYFLLTQGQIYRGWIKPLAKFKDGICDIMDVHYIFSGEENAYRHIKVANRIK